MDFIVNCFDCTPSGVGAHNTDVSFDAYISEKMNQIYLGNVVIIITAQKI